MSVIKGTTDIALIDTFDDVEDDGVGEEGDEDEQRLKRKKVEVTLGTWFFDKRMKKRKYISVSGKVFSGADAVRRSRSEKYHPNHPSQLLRAEFLHTMQSVPIPALLQLYEEHQRQSARTVAEHSSILSNLDVWGLPPLLLARYKQYAKITSLFHWQVDCLLSEDGLILQGQKNFVYSAPTSGGKTLIAELLILRKLSQTMRLGDPKSMNHQRKTIFFIVPFIALAEEKTNYFRQLWQDMNLAIKTFHTDDDLSYNHHQLGEDVELVICTIERANILLTQLLDEKRENQISMIVIDEIHLLSDPHRGFLLEVLLTKILYLLKDQVQIIGMSATLPNIRELATWLQAALYVTTYRPVVLDLLVARHMTVYKVTKDFDVPKPAPPSLQPTTAFDGEQMMIVEDTNSNDSLPRKFMEGISVPLSSPTSSSEALSPPNVRYEDIGRISILVKDDLDGFKSLCVQTMLEEDKSALVFCNSKKRCEVCASAIVASIKEYYQTLSASKLTPHSFSSINPPYSTLKIENSRYQSVPRLPGKANLPASSDIPNKPSVPLNKRQNNPPSYSNGTWVPSNPRHQAVSMNHDALFQSKQQQLFFQRRHLLEELKQTTPIGLCTVLQECLPYGVAYHHAGLSNDERAVIEKGFRTGLIQILCTTSTLSAGVNLPAHKVIIR